MRRYVSPRRLTLNIRPLSRHSGHGRTYCPPDPVANDPKPTYRFSNQSGFDNAVSSCSWQQKSALQLEIRRR
jgi:hypothetical protein